MFQVDLNSAGIGTFRHYGESSLPPRFRGLCESEIFSRLLGWIIFNARRSLQEPPTNISCQRGKFSEHDKR